MRIEMQKLEKRNTYTPLGASIDKNIGKKFGRLTIKSFDKKRKNHKYYICKCKCGNKKSIYYTHLSSGKILSCGCLRKELDIAKRKKDAASRYLYRHYKQNAKYNKKEFDLSYEEFLNITSQNCFYCGKKPLQKCSNKSSSSIYIYNGIDRKDNSKGYNKNNIVPCCSDCNYFKSNMNYNKFLNLIKKIYKYKFGSK